MNINNNCKRENHKVQIQFQANFKMLTVLSTNKRTSLKWCKGKKWNICNRIAYKI